MHMPRFVRLNAGTILVAVMIAVVLAGISTAALLRASGANASDSARSERDVQAEYVAQAALQIAKATLVYTAAQPTGAQAGSWDTYLTTYAPTSATNTAKVYPPDPTFSYRLTVENNDDGGGATDDLDGILVVTVAAYAPSGRRAAYRILLRQPTFADYQWAMNQAPGSHFLYDAAETFTGKFHHNGNITFDVTKTVTFEKSASATGVSPASLWAPYGFTTSPDAPTFSAGKDFAAAPVAINGPTQSIDELRAIAQAAGTYVMPPESTNKHRLLEFYADGTVALRETDVAQRIIPLTVYHYGGPMAGWVGFDPNPKTPGGLLVLWHEIAGVPAEAPRADLVGTTATGIPYTATIGETVRVDGAYSIWGYQTVQVWDQSQVDLIFVEGDVRLKGMVTARTTVVASGDVYFAGDVQYQDLQQDVLGVIAADDVFFETRSNVAPGEDGLSATSSNYIHAAVYAGGQRLVTEAPMTANTRKLYTFGSMANGMLTTSPLEGNFWQGGLTRLYDQWLAQKAPPYFVKVEGMPGTVVPGSFHRLRDVAPLSTTTSTQTQTPPPPPPPTPSLQ